MSIEVVVRFCNLSDLHQLRNPTDDTAINLTRTHSEEFCAF